MSHGATLIRTASSILVAGLLAVGATGCGLVTNQATTKDYSASDGVNGPMVEGVRVVNLLGLTDDGVDVNFIGSIVNDSKDDVAVSFESVDDTSINATIRVDAGLTVRLGIDEDLLFVGLNAAAGSITPIYVQHGAAPGSQLLVPVLNGDLPEYADYLP